ncbi:exopolygalacturonase-like [Zingiber officinale]|uniref:exopolygalacturonase-like n=1 Tax=Zingiber officinale TaxID=94328 RepID=UPI001C4C8384|nr:exopolygalacturonase-like [Zingiber officinale]
MEQKQSAPVKRSRCLWGGNYGEKEARGTESEPQGIRVLAFSVGRLLKRLLDHVEGCKVQSIINNTFPQEERRGAPCCRHGEESVCDDQAAPPTRLSIRGSRAVARASGTYNVRDFGAKGNGVTDDSQAFMEAWKKACASSGRTKVLVPAGTYFLNPIEFSGPCKDVNDLIFQFHGTLKASTDLNKYVNRRGWVAFGWLDHLTLTGGGTFDAQGEVSWPFNKCPTQKNCNPLPSSLIIVNTNNTVVKDITTVNSKFFHIVLMNNNNFKGSGITIKAPVNSPNTDGIHLESNSGVTLSNSHIGTGDDCVSIGQGNSFVTISGIACGPGHGISIGSLGRYNTEKDVKNIIVRDSTFVDTVMGVRIKTWENSPVQTTVQNVTFENLIMKNVGSPVVVDQTYCPFAYCDHSASSRVQLKDIKFKDIRGTAAYREAMILKCSKGLPCQGLKLENIDLTSSGLYQAMSVCLDVRAQFSGKINPEPCK